jgi:hypothetical protein
LGAVDGKGVIGFYGLQKSWKFNFKRFPITVDAAIVILLFTLLQELEESYL